MMDIIIDECMRLICHHYLAFATADGTGLIAAGMCSRHTKHMAPTWPLFLAGMML